MEKFSEEKPSDKILVVTKGANSIYDPTITYGVGRISVVGDSYRITYDPKLGEMFIHSEMIATCEWQEVEE